MTRLNTTSLTRNIGRIAFGALALAAFVTEASAVSPRVRSACAGDYLAYCSQHDPDGPGVRQCMRAHGTRLSASCVSALVAAGEVSKQEIARRSASSK